jgi:hypothetical protein
MHTRTRTGGRCIKTNRECTSRPLVKLGRPRKDRKETSKPPHSQKSYAAQRPGLLVRSPRGSPRGSPRTCARSVITIGGVSQQAPEDVEEEQLLWQTISLHPGGISAKRKYNLRVARDRNSQRQQEGGAPTAKFCTRCLVDKPLGDFSVWAAGRFGRASECAVCCHFFKWWHQHVQGSEADASHVRCICRDTEGWGFMLQCELCNVWQHAECVGFDQRAGGSVSDFCCEVWIHCVKSSNTTTTYCNIVHSI